MKGKKENVGHVREREREGVFVRGQGWIAPSLVLSKARKGKTRRKENCFRGRNDPSVIAQNLNMNRLLSGEEPSSLQKDCQ